MPRLGRGDKGVYGEAKRLPKCVAHVRIYKDSILPCRRYAKRDGLCVQHFKAREKEKTAVE